MPAKNGRQKNWRPKMASQKCRQKHADMSPPQSFHAACPDWPLRVESWRA
jgi:hypothetical protein